MANVQAHTAQLIALFVSCVLYGILLMTFIPSIRSLLCPAGQTFRFRRREDIKFPIVAATSLMFLVSTFSAVMSMQDVIDAFIDYKGPGGALEFYETVNTGWKHWIVAIEDTVQVITGDALLIYRCYVIYDRNWRMIALPALSWLAMTALSITTSYYEAALPGAKRLNDPSVVPVLSATLFLTLTTSAITTYPSLLADLIVRRLFTVEHKANLHGETQAHFLTRVAMVFFETGMIYTLSIIAALGVYLSGSNLEYVGTLALIHIIPITCNLLHIRVEGITRTEPHLSQSSGSLQSTAELKFNAKAMEEV
ncbi:hypothetical protein DFH09DRAFT_1371272 [Mycena vulgaris]|nr:hypothetical protein DFH09DRAFT_1371272 [Mycena vulgaris]